MCSVNCHYIYKKLECGAQFYAVIRLLCLETAVTGHIYHNMVSQFISLLEFDEHDCWLQ
jgi:hypothetical protein